MPVSDATYEQVALEDPEGQWELICGHLRSKPAMAIAHDGVILLLQRILMLQLDPREFLVSGNLARLRVSSGTCYVPDLCVIPRALLDRGVRERPQSLDVHEEPMPLVVEVWSPSTGDYDVEEKLREYQRRGDLEIWRIHPYERTLTAWRRHRDGGYSTLVVQRGTVRPLALPSVSFELESLFAE